MVFYWIRIILINKYAEFLIFDKKINTLRKGALNPLGWSEICKIEIHRPVFYLNPKYTRPIFNPNPNMSNLYLIRSPGLTSLYTILFVFIVFFLGGGEGAGVHSSSIVKANCRIWRTFKFVRNQNCLNCLSNHEVKLITWMAIAQVDSWIEPRCMGHAQLPSRARKCHQT